MSDVDSTVTVLVIVKPLQDIETVMKDLEKLGLKNGHLLTKKSRVIRGSIRGQDVDKLKIDAVEDVTKEIWYRTK